MESEISVWHLQVMFVSCICTAYLLAWILFKWFNVYNEIQCSKRWGKVISVHTWSLGQRAELQFYLSLALAVGGGEWSGSCLGSFTRGEEPRYPLNERLGGPKNQSGWFWMSGNLLPLLVFEPWTIQPVISHCTDCCLGSQNSTVLRILYSHTMGNCIKFPTSGCVYQWLIWYFSFM